MNKLRYILFLLIIFIFVTFFAFLGFFNLLDIKSQIITFTLLFSVTYASILIIFYFVITNYEKNETPIYYPPEPKPKEDFFDDIEAELGFIISDTGEVITI